MATYLILNLLFIAVICLAFAKWFRKPDKAILVTLLLLMLLTAIFDNVIVGLSIVGYDTSKIVGVYVGKAPVEDFMYAILAVIIVPTIWTKLGIHHAR